MSDASLTRSTDDAVKRLIEATARRKRTRSGASRRICSQLALLRQRHPAKRRDRESIGHPRYVVGDPLQLFPPRIRAVEVVVEQAGKRPVDAVVLAARLLAQIDL